MKRDPQQPVDSTTDTVVTYGDSTHAVSPGQTLLEALLRDGVEVPHGCQSGVCRSCTMVALEGQPPADSQKGLADVEKRQGLFLPCICKPSAPFTIGDVDDRLEVEATIAGIERLSPRVAELALRLEHQLDFSPGQFVSLVRDDGLARSYSIASQPEESELVLHVGRIRGGGRMSDWVNDHARPGMTLHVRGPYGTCCYVADEPEAPLLLAGVGTGLAPLWGILNDALKQRHRGQIVIAHGASTLEELYMHSELAAIGAEHDNVEYCPVVLEGPAPRGGIVGSLDTIAMGWVKDSPNPTAWWSYLCGSPQFVQALRKGLFLAGCGFRRILADAFVSAPPPAT